MDAATPARPGYRAGLTRMRRIVPLLAVGLLLAGAAVAAALATPQITSVPVPQLLNSEQPGQASAPTGHPPPSAGVQGQVQHASHLPGWVTAVLSVLCFGLVAAIVAVIIWMLLRDSLTSRRGTLPPDEDEPATPAAARDDVLAAVDAGLSELDDADADPRRAVIACWLRLEEAAASAGTPRRAGDSPTELVLRLLSAHQVSAPVLYALAEVYRRARYATHAVDTGMRDQARNALRQLRAELAREPVMGGNR